MKLSYQALTKDTWKDFEDLFGKNGACGGCWCMLWRLSAKEFDTFKGEKNKELMKGIVYKGISPGILLYEETKPVGWCAVAPRDQYPKLERSRTMKAIDDKAVWSVSCFFIAKDHRGKGYSVELLKAAKKFCRSHGAALLEGYPSDTKKKTAPPFIWTGTLSGFIKAGFSEVARPSETRVIVRSKL